MQRRTFLKLYAGKFLSLNRFIWGFNVLEYCLLNNTIGDVVDGSLDYAPIVLAIGTDTGCNTMSLAGEFIPSYNTGIRLQDRLSMMALGSTKERVWIRAMSMAKAEGPPNRAMPSTTNPVKPLPEIIFFTDPVAGGHVGCVYCIVGAAEDGTPI